MRGELFPEINVAKQQGDIKVNPYISDDLETLQKHYTIIVEYVKELEEKLRKEKELTRKLKAKVLSLENNIYESDYTYFIEEKATDSELIKENKSLKTSNAGLHSTILRKDRRIQDLSLLLLESLDEVIELKRFKHNVIDVLNKEEIREWENIE